MTMPLYEDRLSLLLPDNDWLGKKSTVTWKDVAKLPLCLLSPLMHERGIMDQAFSSAGCQRATTDGVQLNLPTGIPCHERGSCHHRSRKFHAGQQRISVARVRKVITSPTVSQKIGLVWAKGTPIQPMAKATIELMEEAVSKGQLQRIFSK